ncbi:WD40 repeat domain-containing serine/threonine protein kinase [Amycolatopsis albispora]|uniref:Protein kinase domain-containing protein n=1 Tax=Amycolatopsis albispora TaxID=1804986 RepID=A0A344L0A0_9PSEU|nr:serine/threonine-protein kinase [Amycolatopsis albispora]AXB41474.1 hypothetical protein A4R43_02150 [Amycolatopsis albispora]
MAGDGVRTAVTPVAPAWVGPYRVFAELGRGGMGRVLLGHGADGRLFALKLVHEQFAEDDGFRARFRREIEASRAVSGAYTAAVVDADPDAPTPWLASVFVPAPSLQEVLSATGALPEEPVLRLAAGLASALVQIHQAGVVHRDLKPSNVLLADDGVRVIDFGIARAADTRGRELTRSGWLIGSPAFMSPEQARGEHVTAAGDVFALGSVVAAACTGASPFTATATLQTLINVAQADPDLDRLPPAVRRVVEPCLAKDPAARPTPAEVLRSVGQIAPAARAWPAAVHRMIAERQSGSARLATDAGATKALPDRTPTAVRTTVQPGRTRRWWPAAVALALVVAGVLAWVLWPVPPITPAVPESMAPASPFPLTGALTGATPAEAVTFSPDGRTVAVVNADRTVQLWDVAAQEPVGQILGPFGDQESALDLVFSADSAALVTAQSDETATTVRWWDVRSGNPAGEPLTAGIDPADEVRQNTLGPGGRTLATSGDRGLVYLWDLTARRLTGTADFGEGNAADVVFSPDGATFATRGGDPTATSDTVLLWDTATRSHRGAPITLPDSAAVDSLDVFTFSPDGRTLLTAGQ